MKERRQIVELHQQTPGGVLVSLVRAEGSSYRRPGARLLTVSSPAAHAGTLSGGCLEAEVIRKAAWIAREHAVVERYTMGFDDTADIPFGLGCGGTVDLLFEPVESPEGSALMQAIARSLQGHASTVVSFLPGGGRALRRLILSDEAEVIFASADLKPEKIECARALHPGKIYEGRFVERLEAPQRLVVLGAGDDARPLVELAALLGWSVTVADGRLLQAQGKRFPLAEHVIALDSSSDERLQIGAGDAVVLMTHSYEQDRELLVRALPLTPRYLGLLGSRHRSSLLLSEAAAMLGTTVAACCQRVFAPVGMDLGGDGPEAIALAIVAEIQAVCHLRIGSPRRLTPVEVAEQIERGGASLYLKAQCALDLS